MYSKYKCRPSLCDDTPHRKYKRDEIESIHPVRRSIGPHTQLSYFAQIVKMLSARIVLERGNAKAATRFAIRSIFHPKSTLLVAEFLASGEGRAISDNAVVNMLVNLGRPYVRRGLGPRERADLLVTHYRAIIQHFGKDIARGLSDGEEMCLTALTGSDGEVYRLILRRTPVSLRREGEATISLIRSELSASLADITFAIGPVGSDDDLVIRVGGLQGPRPPHGKAAVRAATKALDGLRPKASVVEALYSLAARLGVEVIVATSLRGHVLNRSKRARMHRGPYDDFWRELGATRRDDGDFVLPSALPHRDFREVPAKRRREWKRRQSRLTSIAEQTNSALSGAVAPTEAVAFAGDGELTAEGVSMATWRLQNVCP